ncbi:MAG: hypothetical protein QOD72_124, partial [Acidimicrobiaceae bacterium]|nr:hypothetical protein [Acidimicrobiaceae bacterium]
MNRHVSRIAIVNRGEPAMRLINAVRELREEGDRGLVAIALHTAAERRAMFVREADEAVAFEAVAGNPYLDLGALERALVAARADAAWVGWGFVAERPEFAELCDRLGVIFIGPGADVMRRLGDKIGAKLLAEAADVPVAPWSGGAVTDVDDAGRHAADIGFPLMVKAAAGGGGRGIRLVTTVDELADAVERAKAEAANAFGDDTVFLERVVTGARHVEVQVIGDDYGTVWAVGVRDCSVQRRNQKVIEESRSTALTPDQEHDLAAAATRLCAAAGYRNAGTVEFLYQPATGEFAFLEVNTRLQVEHTVTEVTTGIDLVKLQLFVAGGGRLEGTPPPPFGHAMEARLNAEDPQRGFAPSPGTVEAMELATGPGVRVDTGVAEGDVIPPEYDSMIAKVIAWGRDRSEARGRLRRALAQSTVLIGGGTTNKSFLLDILDRPELRTGSYDTGWLDRLTAAPHAASAETGNIALLMAAVNAYDAEAHLERDRFLGSANRGRPLVGNAIGHEVDLRQEGHSYRVHVARAAPGGWYRLSADGDVVDVLVERLGRSRSRVTVGARAYRIVSAIHGPDHLVEVDGDSHRFSQDDGGVVRSPAAAVVVSVSVAPGDVVMAGARLVLLEAMKMEVAITAPVSGTVSEVLVTPNVQVEAGAPLLRLEPSADNGDQSPAGSARLRLPEFAGRTKGDDRGHCLELLDALRSFVLGYDLRAADAIEMAHDYQALGPRLEGDDTVVRAELEVLDSFADLCLLTRERRDAEGVDTTARAAREWFHIYLRSLDADREGLPDRFRQRLSRALA